MKVASALDGLNLLITGEILMERYVGLMSQEMCECIVDFLFSRTTEHNFAPGVIEVSDPQC